MDNKKDEHDQLQLLSEKDLWCQDLDAFVQEWENQLKEDAEYTKSIRNAGRRASRKIGAGKTMKSRNKKDDDDFNPSKSKAASKALQPNYNKGVIKVEPKPHKGFLEMFNAKPKPKAKPYGSDGAEEDLSGMSEDDFAALGPAKQSKQTSRAPSEQPAADPAIGRSKRAAAAAPKKWLDVDEESESDDGKFLGDVGAMVKGIGGESIDNTATNGRLSLFAMSRPATSHGDRPTSSSGLPKLKSKASRVFDVSDGDETNYEMLARSSPHKAAPAPRNDLDSFLSDEEDLVPITKKVPVKAAPAAVAKSTTKRGPKSKAAAAPEKPTQAEPKPTGLSPAAKAYAAKQNKLNLAKKNVFSDDEDDDIEMNDSPPPKPIVKAPAPKSKAVIKAPAKRQVISDDEDDEMEDPPQPKPVARAPAPKPKAKVPAKRNVISDDEDDDDDDIAETSDSPPRATGRGRPARAAVAKAKYTKPAYMDSDDDSMDVDDLDASAVVEEDEQSEDDFDDSD
jgi:DNA topoisomerase-2